MRSDLEREDRSPEELREAAEDCRHRAEQAAEVYDLFREAADTLSTLADHQYLTDEESHHVDLLDHMLGIIQHGGQYGYDAHYLKEHADRLAYRADAIESEQEHNDAE